MLGPEEFGRFSVIYIGAQLLYSFLFQWLILPVTSSPLLLVGRKSKCRQAISAVAVSLSVVLIYCLLIAEMEVFLVQISQIVVLGGVMIGSEYYRYHRIRQRALNRLILTHVVKWVLALMIFCSYKVMTLNTVYISYLFALLLQLIFLIGKKDLSDGCVEGIRNGKRELFQLGAANVYNTMAYTVLIKNIDMSSLGAVQAFRSIVNIFPFMVQYVETHYSAKIISQGKSKIFNVRLFGVVCLILGFTNLLVYVFSDSMVILLLGMDFLNYSSLVFFLFLLVSVQCLGRLCSVQLRMLGVFLPFLLNSYVLWLGTLVYIYLSLSETVVVTTEEVLVGLVVISTVQLLNLVYSLRRNKLLAVLGATN